MRYRYLDDFRRGISVFAIFSYGIAVWGTPQCPPQGALVKSKGIGKTVQYSDKLNYDHSHPTGPLFLFQV